MNNGELLDRLIVEMGADCNVTAATHVPFKDFSGEIWRMFDVQYKAGGINVSVELELGKRKTNDFGREAIPFVTRDEQKAYIEARARAVSEWKAVRESARNMGAGIEQMVIAVGGGVAKPFELEPTDEQLAAKIRFAEAPLVDYVGDNQLRTAKVVGFNIQYSGPGDKFDVSALMRQPVWREVVEKVADHYGVKIRPISDGKIRKVSGERERGFLGDGLGGGYIEQPRVVYSLSCEREEMAELVMGRVKNVRFAGENMESIIAQEVDRLFACKVDIG